MPRDLITHTNTDQFSFIHAHGDGNIRVLKNKQTGKKSGKERKYGSDIRIMRYNEWDNNYRERKYREKNRKR